MDKCFRRAVGVALLLLTRMVGAQQPVVKIDTGALQGVTDSTGVSSFKGIPYAAPPVGPLRWKTPQSAAAWQGTRVADHYSAACIQPPGMSAENGGDVGVLSEDCLYLNVWTPRLGAGPKLPVMVWIHGGAYIFGSGGLALYDGTPLAKKGAVVVALNYRLGALGFFAHPALEAESPNGAVNFGLLDQIAALQWVQRNIAQFGGDPGNVTILGQSAGARSVLALFASPLAAGLFQKGVALSNYALPDASRAKAVSIGTNIATAMGLNGASATMEELRAVPAEKFGALSGKQLSLAPVPVAGDPVLPISVQDCFDQGKEQRVPLILGNTSDDSSVVVAFGVDPAALLKSIRGAGIVLKTIYPGVTSDAELGRQVARDAVFTLSARYLADRHAKRAATWRYYFSYVTTGERGKYPHGVAHGAEIAYVLDTLRIYPGTKSIATAEDAAFAKHVSDYFFHFAATGQPFSHGSVHWLPQTARRDATLEFGRPIALRENFMKARLNLFLTVLRVLAALQ